MRGLQRIVLNAKQNHDLALRQNLLQINTFHSSISLPQQQKVVYCPYFKCLFLWASPWLSVKESACNVGNTGLILGSGRYPGEGNGNPLQHSCLENLMKGGAQVTVHGVTESWTRLSEFTSLLFFSQLFVRPPQTAILLLCISFLWGWS